MVSMSSGFDCDEEGSRQVLGLCHLRKMEDRSIAHIGNSSDYVAWCSVVT